MGVIYHFTFAHNSFTYRSLMQRKAVGFSGLPYSGSFLAINIVPNVSVDTGSMSYPPKLDL